MFAHTFFAPSDWSLEFDAYVGEWSLIETALAGIDPSIARASDGLGFQFWLNTPVSGLRFGVGGHKKDLSGGSPARRAPDEKVSSESLTLSVELVLSKFIFRAETWRLDEDQASIFFSTLFNSSYVQVGYQPIEKFRINLQYEFGDVEIPAGDLQDFLGTPITSDMNFDFRKDFGISLNYLFSPNLVLKLEHHITEYEEFNFDPVFDGPGPPVAFMPAPFDSGDEGSYTILSLSTSF